MNRLHTCLLERLLIIITMVSIISISSMGRITRAGASTISQTNSDGQVVTVGGSKTYNDTDKAWTYIGNWSNDKTRRTVGGQLHVSNKIENYATISIEAARFTLIYSRSRHYGQLDIFVDDQKIGTINQNKSKTSHQEEWNSPELAAGMHLIKFVHVRGKAVNIDAIKVRGPKASPSPTPTGVPTLEAIPTQVAPQIPNLIETPTPVQNDPAVLTVTHTPTTSVLFAEPTSTLPAEPTASPTFSEVAPTATSTPELIPSSTPTSTPSEVHSPTVSFTATATLTSPSNPTRTNTQIPTFATTATPTSTVTSTATTPPAPSTSLRAYYVSAAGNNTDGKSWSTAWTGLGQVNWSIIQPGDTIYLSGGASSATYPGGIQISKSGTASAYITIDIGANSPFPTGHSGTVTIDGGAHCIRATGSYVKIRNLHCQHATHSGLQIRGVSSVLENNTVSETYGQGLYVYNCIGCVVRGNRVTTFPNDGPNESRPFQTDGIVAYSSSDTLIERNWIRLTNQYESAHIDGIQASQLIGANYSNITIQYNYVENTKAATRNAQGIYVTQMQGDVKIIGNVVVIPFGNLAVASHLPNNFPVKVQVIGNTLKNGGYQPLYVEDDDPVIKNNIIWQTGNVDPYVKNGALVRLDGWRSSNPANIDNNLLHSSHDPTSIYAFYIGSTGVSWSAWQAKGFDEHGIFGKNPNLDSCFRPTGTSPSVGRGAILGDEYSQGLSLSLCGPNGPAAFLPVMLYNRIQYGGPSWDIGAYEFSVIK